MFVSTGNNRTIDSVSDDWLLYFFFFFLFPDDSDSHTPVTHTHTHTKHTHTERQTQSMIQSTVPIRFHSAPLLNTPRGPSPRTPPKMPPIRFFTVKNEQKKD